MHFTSRAAAVVAALLFCLGNNALSAEEQTVLKPLDRPDSTSVTVPKLVATSKVYYSYFYKAGVSYERAFSDLDECRMYSLQAGLAIVVPPKFVPLGSDAVKSERAGPTPQFFMMYGVVGILVAEAFIASAEDDTADATNRRCMMYKGYTRYGTSRATGKQITAGTDAERLARLALIASGPQPSEGMIGP